MSNLKPLRSFSKENKIFFLGDTHGYMNNFFYNCQRADLRDIIVFHVGDFGVGFKNHKSDWLNKINDKLKERNIIMYAIRGNHDDPSFFKGDYILSNLKLVPDYTTLKFGDRRFLLVGGAISVDRFYRIGLQYEYEAERVWWKDEVFKLDTNRLKKYRGITDVITHSAPDYVPPFPPLPQFIIANSREDSRLLSDLRMERFHIARMADILSKNNKINNWYYGHFHTSQNYKVGDTNFILLDVNELI